MAWIAVPVNLERSPEIGDLSDHLGIEPLVAAWAMVRLWSWAVDHRDDGQLADVSDKQLGRALGGVDGATWRAAMVESDVLEADESIVNWRQIYRLKSQRQRQAKSRASRHGGVTTTSLSRHGDALQDRTGQDKTGQDHKAAPAKPPPSPKKAKFDPMEAELPWECIRPEWRDWCVSRRESGKPLKPTTVKLQLEQLREMGPKRAAAALLHSARGGYQGIFEPKGGPQGGPPDYTEGRAVGSAAARPLGPEEQVLRDEFKADQKRAGEERRLALQRRRGEA